MLSLDFLRILTIRRRFFRDVGTIQKRSAHVQQVGITDRRSSLLDSSRLRKDQTTGISETLPLPYSGACWGAQGVPRHISSPSELRTKFKYLSTCAYGILTKLLYFFLKKRGGTQDFMVSEIP